MVASLSMFRPAADNRTPFHSDPQKVLVIGAAASWITLDRMGINDIS